MTSVVGQRPIISRRANPQYPLFVQAKTREAWPEGKEVTEDEFDQAVAAAAGGEQR